MQLGAGAPRSRRSSPSCASFSPSYRDPPRSSPRERAFDSSTRSSASSERMRPRVPLVLVLDDLHAADEPSLLLAALPRSRARHAWLLVIGTYRDVDPTVHDPLASTLAELVREPVTRRIELGGLERGRGRAATSNAQYGTPPRPELAAAICDETEGNPLFVGEVVRLLAAEGRLERGGRPRALDVGIPQGIREVIGRRVRRLSEGCDQVLTLASVLGREFELEALQHVSAVGGDELLDLLDEACRGRSIDIGAGRRTDGCASRTRSSVRRSTRSSRHRAVSNSTAASARRSRRCTRPIPEPHLTELAYHFFEAAPGGDVAKALNYARRAGDRALDLLAYEEAARLYELALQALDSSQSADVRVRYELLVARGQALARGGSTREAKEAFVSAADLARTSGSPGDFARAVLGYGGLFPWLRAGADQRLVPLLQEALERLDDREAVLRVRLLARLAGALRDEPSLEPGPRSAARPSRSRAISTTPARSDTRWRAASRRPGDRISSRSLRSWRR